MKIIKFIRARNFYAFVYIIILQVRVDEVLWKRLTEKLTLNVTLRLISFTLLLFDFMVLRQRCKKNHVKILDHLLPEHSIIQTFC